MTGIFPTGIGMRGTKMDFTAAAEDEGMEGISIGMAGMGLSAFGPYYSRPAPHPMARLDKNMDIFYRFALCPFARCRALSPGASSAAAISFII
jgi:hypothetical protein